MPFQTKDKTVVEGGNADLVIEFTNDDGTLKSISGTPTITITKPDGTNDVSNTNMKREVIGRWFYDYSTPTGEPGNYKAVASADVDTTNGTRTEKQELFFEVVAA